MIPSENIFITNLILSLNSSIYWVKLNTILELELNGFTLYSLITPN